MVKNLVIGTILLCMVLHSACRLGILSRIYQQRNEIAFALGLIDEKPIAMCDNDYDFTPGLTIHAADENDKTLPPQIFRAQEIHLYLPIQSDFDLSLRRNVSLTERNTALVEWQYPPPTLSIFHPPS